VTAPWHEVLMADRIEDSEIPPLATGERVTCSLLMPLPSVARAARMARRATCEALLAWGIGQLRETAVVLVSELVTNAVQHTRTASPTIMLRLEVVQTTLRIEVEDADPRWPQPRRPAGLDESGFGFVMIEALAREWGLRDTVTGKAVWAELAIDLVIPVLLRRHHGGDLV
jgi:anti-sigma regulatory factor (Ser/Thr protein kinase)